MESISSDSALSKKEQDRFNRYPFAKRVAQTILERKDEEGLVIGIYGEWGEGKTTVLNFIHGELEIKYPELVTVRFNPWRFTEESQLIKEFYNAVAVEVIKSLPPKKKTAWEKLRIKKSDEPLLKNSESLGEKMKSFGMLLDVIGLGEGVKGIGDALSAISLETLKERLGIFLKTNNKKLVIFVDDIDRLDKEEVHSIFRLVKLNADFLNTIYILSFDEVMVSKMVGSKYGDNAESGFFFLEKIIQVPLYLPKAHPNNLRLYFLNRAFDTLSDLKITLNESDKREFAGVVDVSFLIRLNTPRIAVRFANILNYTLPILEGEVNVVDLMLIEGMRLFYPNHYDFIQSNPNLILGGFRGEGAVHNLELDRKKILTANLDSLELDFNEKERLAVRHLVLHLFPRLKEIFGNMSYGDRHESLWFRQKRVCAAKYFQRYFGLALQQGEISDRTLNAYLTELSAFSEEEGFERFKTLTNDVDAESLVTQLRVHEDALTWNIGKRISMYLAKMPKTFLGESTPFSFYANPFDQSVMLLKNLVQRNKNEPDATKFVDDIVSQAETIDFSFECFRRLTMIEKDSNDEIFIQSQKVELFNKFKERIFSEAEGVALFERFPELSWNVFYYWSEWISDDEVKAYVNPILQASPEKAFLLLKVYTPTYFSSGSRHPLKDNFGEVEYKKLRRICDIDLFMKCLKSSFSSTDFEGVAGFKGKGDTPEPDYLRQFAHWYEMDYASGASTG